MKTRWLLPLVALVMLLCTNALLAQLLTGADVAVSSGNEAAPIITQEASAQERAEGNGISPKADPPFQTDEYGYFNFNAYLTGLGATGGYVAIPGAFNENVDGSIEAWVYPTATTSSAPASAYGTGGGLVRLSRAADGRVRAEEVYFTNKMQNHHGGMVLLDGSLYGANGGNSGGYLLALDFQTGQVHWDQRAEGRKAPKGSLAFAGGRLYYRTEDGPMLLIEPSPKAYLERGRFEQPARSGKPAWAHPVIANGRLYLRDHDVLLAYDIRKK